jgi:hypothetical protein
MSRDRLRGGLTTCSRSVWTDLDFRELSIRMPLVYRTLVAVIVC